VQLTTKVEVGDHVEVVTQGQVLKHRGDPEALRFGGCAHVDCRAVEGHRPGIRAVDAGNGLDQGGLTGAVVPDQRQHLTGADVQVDVLEGLNSSEPLGNSL